MKKFKIFENSSNNKIEIVSQGWSWLAFLFHIFWFIYKKNWHVVLPLLVISSAEYKFLFTHKYNGTFWTIIGMLLLTITPIVLGFCANKWQEENLKRKGFKYEKEIQSINQQMALTEYLRQKEIK